MVRIYCIGGYDTKEAPVRRITIGRWYIAERWERYGSYRLTNDIGGPEVYPFKYFITEEEHRDTQIDKIIGN